MRSSAFNFLDFSGSHDGFAPGLYYAVTTYNERFRCKKG